MGCVGRRWTTGWFGLASLGAALALSAPTAQAVSGIENPPPGLEHGHPELYENGSRIGEKAGAAIQAGFGQIHFEAQQLGSEGTECVNVGFGSGWNEGPAGDQRARGQILGWAASGHVPEGAHPKLSASCRPETAGAGARYATDEAFIESEENASKEVEPTLRKLSIPWNLELYCGVRDEEYVAIAKVGVPSSEFPHSGNSPCPPEVTPEAQIEEESAYAKERTQHHGCYVSDPAPEGCIRVTIVEPAAALEVAFGGTLWAHGMNGVKSGLFPTTWDFEGATSGGLQCEFPTGCVATGAVTGDIRDLGYKNIALIQAR